MNTPVKEFIPLTNNLLFKETYGNPKNISFLEDLLECYFDLPEHDLQGRVKVAYESQISKSRYKDKSIRGDLVATIDDNLIINLEMQNIFDNESWRKCKTYVMRIYATQLDRSENYNLINKVTQIVFVKDVKIDITNEVKNTLYLGSENLSDDFNIDIIRLDLSHKLNYNVSTKFIKRLKFIAAQNEEERASIAKGDECLMQMDKWLESYVNDETLKDTFDERKWNAHIEFNRGVKTIASNMLAKDKPIDEIIELTGLTKEEIEKLK